MSQAACASVCRTKISPHPPPPPPHPTFPPTPKIITRSFVDNVVKRFKHLATCQASCNVPTICKVTTSSKCAICDKLQEKIRSIASRPAQKVTGPACACVGQKFPTPSPTPPSPPPPHPKNNHAVNRRQCCETFQAFCNVPTI